MWCNEDEIRTMLRDSASGFLDSEHSRGRVRKLRGTEPGYDPGFWTKMAEMGWTGILLPESDGGSALGLAPALTLASVLGEQLVPEPFISSAIQAATLIEKAPGDEAARVRGALAAGAAIVVPVTGTNVRYAPASGGIVLSGTAVHVADWHRGAVLAVQAEGPDGPALILVDAALAQATPRRMADGTWMAAVTFDEVTVEPSCRVLTGAAVAEVVPLAEARARLGVSAMLEGLARRVLAMTTDYVGQRVQFGKPLATLQALRHSLVGIHLQVELGAASWRVAAERLEADGLAAAVAQIASAKARAADAALAAAKAAVQFHGAFGYTEEADVGLYLNAALRLAPRFGSAESQRQAALAAHAPEAA